MYIDVVQEAKPGNSESNKNSQTPEGSVSELSSYYIKRPRCVVSSFIASYDLGG